MNGKTAEVAISTLCSGTMKNIWWYLPNIKIIGYLQQPIERKEDTQSKNCGRNGINLGKNKFKIAEAAQESLNDLVYSSYAWQVSYI